MKKYDCICSTCLKKYLRDFEKRIKQLEVQFKKRKLNYEKTNIRRNHGKQFTY